MRDYLQRVPTFAQKGSKAAHFGLESIRAFLVKTGSPHLAYPTVHVAGTNGKGTTCRLLASILMESGYKTGITTSPHLLSYHERIQVGDEKISDLQMLDFFRETGKALDECELTYFELMTAAAFWYFARQKVDVAVIETGLGGRLDATNVISPICTVITTISMDHTDLLGETFGAIAKEKGGIVKPGIPLVTGQLPDEAFRVLDQIALTQHSTLIPSPTTGFRRTEDGIKLDERNQSISVTRDELSDVDLMNMPVVLNCIKTLKKQGLRGISDSSLAKGLQRYRQHFPLRSTFSPIRKDKSWYYDGAHNIESLEFLLIQLERIAPLKDWTVVFSIMKDKLRPEIPVILSQIEKRYFMSLSSERAATYEDLLECWTYSFKGSSQATDYPDSQIPDPPVCLHDVTEIQRRFSDELVIFTGSFYFYESLMMTEHNDSPFHT